VSITDAIAVTDLPASPPPPILPPFTRAWLLCLVVLTSFLAQGTTVQALNVPFGVWFTELVVFLGIPWVLLLALGVDPVRTTGLASTRPAAVALGFGLGLVNYAAWAIPLMAVAQAVFPPELLRLYDGGQLFLHQAGPERVLLVAGLGLAAPLGEEFLFRGILQPGLMSRLPPARAIVVTALVFSAFHFDPVGLVPRFELGVLFGLLAWRSGSVWPGIAAHAANNLTATALYYLADGGEDRALPWAVAGGLFVVGNLGLLLLARAAVGRLLAPRPMQETARTPVALWRGLLALVVPALAAVAGYLALDWRGAMLRSMEVSHPLPPGVVLPPELETMRARARRGEVPLEEYLEARSLVGPADAPGAAPHRKE
jgi:uncharacterized protein